MILQGRADAARLGTAGQLQSAAVRYENNDGEKEKNLYLTRKEYTRLERSENAEKWPESAKHGRGSRWFSMFFFGSRGYRAGTEKGKGRWRRQDGRQGARVCGEASVGIL
jgi:hypothetical protein